ncbi:MAG: MFS transporter [Verrucomicrobiota bacterium]|nr:MFS transporter [Verrucomicrobiota bacterium]
MSLKPKQNKGIGRSHYLVLTAAFLGWLFDGFEMGLFPIVARPALTDMYAGSGGPDAFVGLWMGRITAVFLLGAAIGGVVFGWLGDRVGRVKAMSASILTYAIFTGLGYFAEQPWHLAVFRFLASLGMGGEWSLGVALVMEYWPERLRPLMAGIIGAAANFGFLLVAAVGKFKEVTVDSWRWMWLVGVLPAFLVFFIRLFVPESERWKAARATQKTYQPLREVFSPSLIRHTLLAICFSSIALIGTWGSVQWIPVWVDQMVGEMHPTAKNDVGMLSAMGAIIGCLAGPMIGGRLGRRPAFFCLCLASLLVCGFLFRSGIPYGGSFQFLVFLAGMTTAAFYGWFPLYLPELFPTRCRATGQGIGYNTGRVFAALGAIAGGQLVVHFDGDYARMGALITMIYLVGMFTIWLAPETKGNPLPT